VYIRFRNIRIYPPTLLPRSNNATAGKAKIRPGIRANPNKNEEKKRAEIPVPIIPHSPKIANQIPETVPPNVVIKETGMVAATNNDDIIFSRLVIIQSSASWQNLINLQLYCRKQFYMAKKIRVKLSIRSLCIYRLPNY